MVAPLATAPRDFLLDDSGDLFVQKDLALALDTAAIVQSVRIKLNWFLAEWFLNLDVGIPYRQSILTHRKDLAIRVAQIEFRDALVSIVGVVRVDALKITVDSRTRKMFVNFTIFTTTGDTVSDSINADIDKGTPPEGDA